MVMIPFTFLKEKILNGEKQQTIRKPRKRSWKVNDILNLYWNTRTKYAYKLMDVPLQTIERKMLKDFTEAEAIADGFNSLSEMQDWFSTTHKKYIADEEEDYVGFDLIKWNWNQRFNESTYAQMMTIEGQRLADMFEQTLGISVTVKPEVAFNRFLLIIPTQNVIRTEQNGSLTVILKK